MGLPLPQPIGATDPTVSSLSSFVGEPEKSSVTAPSGVVEQSTTKFYDDKEVSQRDESAIAHMSDLWSSLNDTQDVEQSLKDFLGKPIVLQSGVFSISDSFSFFNSFSLPEAAFATSQGSVWVEKLRGFLGMRMDMRLKLVVNANRFQQGRYCIGWTPLCGATNTTSNLKAFATNTMHNNTLVQRTTVPHVEIDLATETSCEILIPFTSVYNFYALSNTFQGFNNAQLGFFNIYPYSPLVSPTGGSTCSYTLFISFENIKLIGASSPQALSELGNKMNGPVSGPAMRISRAFNEVSHIPLLTDFAHSVSWISDRIAKVSSIFGFSKPSQGDGILKVEMLNNPNHSTVDGDSDGRALAFVSQPAVLPIKGISGTAFDEMDFAYITRKYAFWQSLTWNESDSGSLGHIQVSVGDKYIENAGVFNYTPVSFVSHFFNVWRGSLKFRIKIVKTEFHSGRLQLSFFPHSGNFLTFGNAAYVNRMVVDIREHNEIEFLVPFIYHLPWAERGARIGIVDVAILDSLVAPESVSNYVTLLCEVCGGDDFEVAMPGSFNAMPLRTAVPQSLNPRSVEHVFGDTPSTNPVIYSGHTVGDKVSSFRALLRRFHPITPNTREPANAFRFFGPQAEIFVDSIPVRNITPPAYYILPDPLSIVALCYGLWGGGIRIKDVMTLGVVTGELSVVQSNTATAISTQLVGELSQNRMVWIKSSTDGNPPTIAHQVIQQVFNQNTLTVEAPQYTTTLKRCVADLWVSESASPNASDPRYDRSATRNKITMSYPGTLVNPDPLPSGFDSHNLFRAMADDGELSVFISIPPLVFFTPPNYYTFG